jgi:Flp pilus assembly protein TadG
VISGGRLGLAMNAVRRSTEFLQKDSTPRAPKGTLFRVLRHDGGVSALEFGLFAPLLAFGFLALLDTGLAAFQRMTIDHVLRSGAASAMADAGEATVRKVLDTTAAQNFSTGGPSPLALSVARFCACPDSTSTKVTCTTICTGSKPTLAFYSLSATKSYTGIILPSMTFRPQLEVQIR